ncbi:MAG: TonB-dependent receptor, partial [Myxococcota bacterium]
FVKGYGLRTQGSAGPLINSDGEQEPVSATRRTLGVGDGLLWSPFSWFSVRASYEWATRLPEADELFGNGQLIQPNLELRPERSHNANLATLWSIPLGDDASLDAEVQGFVRSTEDLIFLVNYGLTSNYENIAAVDTRGLEVGMNLRPATWASVGGNLTWLDARNRSLEGQFARFDGERIPNMPYLTGNVHTTLTMRPGSHLVQGYTYGRYVHEFFRFWEGEGDRGQKLTVPSQWNWTVGTSWSAPSRQVSVSLEVQNILDARNFDSFGVELPGRSVHAKLTVSPEL